MGETHGMPGGGSFLVDCTVTTLPPSTQGATPRSRSPPTPTPVPSPVMMVMGDDDDHYA